MINVQTIVRVVDNSGALVGGCIHVSRSGNKKGALPGQKITISVKKNIFKKHIVKKSKIIVKGQICKALVVRSTRSVKRWGHFYLSALHNCVILLNQYDLPYATRIFGPIFREIRQKTKYAKVVHLTQLLL